jgi:tRNA 5-methylaminomethyl-2-thiouridine biosynthesis bifunctional protein
MQDFTLEPIRPARIDWQDDTPFASDYGDSYFMPGRGPEEAEAVFVRACGLRERFEALPLGAVFVIGETGFGTGLNLLLAAHCFLERAPDDAQLHLISAELHPLPLADLERAHSHWPQLAHLSEPLRARWPDPAPGTHRIALNDRVALTLMYGPADIMWSHSDAQVDAWFLDGFAPARNPAAWSDPLLGAVAARSRPGARVATFTAAGAVRRGLSEVGFEVQRLPGFGGKRHRLEGQFEGRWSPQRTRSGHVVVVGAGFAGCTSARALAQRGWQVQVFDPGAGQAPPELSAVLYASASHHLTAQNRFYLNAFLHARRYLRDLGFPRESADGRLEGVVQHLLDPRMAEKTRRAVAAGTWPESVLEALGDDAVRFKQAGCLNVARWCELLLAHPGITVRSERLAFSGHPATDTLIDGSGSALECDALVLCTAGDTMHLPGLEWLPLRRVRGQVTFCHVTEASRHWRQTHCHAGYLTPAVEGVHCVGATFDRGRERPVIDPVDDEHNLAELQRNLPDRWQALGGGSIEVVGQHAGLRCQSADTLPLVGPVADAHRNPHSVDPAVWLNIAHGSKGLTHTPLSASLIADRLSGHPPAVDTGVIAALAPERFIERKRRRDPDWYPDGR